jgi:hypothetical protein
MMSSPNGRISKRAVRAMGLILVLGMPLAVMSTPNPGVDVRNPGRVGDPGPSASLAAESAPAANPASANTAPPLPAFDSIEIRESRPAPAATPVTTIVNDPRCGPGFTSAAVTGRDAFACFHSAADPLSPHTVNHAHAASKAPVCMGNGVNGPRIQFVYMYVEGQPDRTNVMVPRIINEFAPRMEGVFRETSKMQGRELGLRLHMPGCRLVVDTVTIDEANGQPADAGVMHTRITERLIELGYGGPDRKFVLWFDGGNIGSCGISPSYSSAVGNVTDSPVTGNISNVGWQEVSLIGETAVIYRWGFPLLGDFAPEFPGQPSPAECWGRGGTGATTEIHELVHNLGAVNRSAPNWNGADGHCLDDNDIMCQNPPGATQNMKFLRCNTPVEQLDCGSDDYFNVRPAVGSYLSTHWNVASSRFLGEAIVHDAIPVELPRF